ncbi:MAG: VOC family protein [Rubrivivax sp.]|nr:VOC family protein [Rubrivivax sp.]
MNVALAQKHQLHGVQPVLAVPDVTAAAQWFVDILGFTLEFTHGEPPQHARVKLGDRSWGDPIYIHLSRREAAAPAEVRLHAGHDIDGLHAHAAAQGAHVLQPPTDQPWGLRELVLEAPGGHRLVIGAEISGVATHDAPRTVIACYRPKPGQETALRALVRAHVPELRRLGLATEHAPLAMTAADGTVLEVFEWSSAQAIEAAHGHPEVQGLWAEFERLCQHVRLADLREAQGLFAEFAPLADR